MDERKTKLSDRLLQSRRELMQALETVPPDLWAATQVNDGWTVLDVVAHLASAERGHQTFIEAVVSGSDTFLPGFDLDEFNAAEVGARRGLGAAAVLEELEQSRAATLALLDVLGPDDWLRSGYHPGGFDSTAEGGFRVIAIHERRHAKELRDALQPR